MSTSLPAIVVDKATRTSSRGTSASVCRSARRRNVRTSSFRRSCTADGRPATTRATSRSSRTRCWNVAAIWRRSSISLRCTSSMVTSRPLPRSSTGDNSSSRASRNPGERGGGGGANWAPPRRPTVNPVSARRFPGARSRVSNARTAERRTRSRSPGVAVSSMVTQPVVRAISVSSASTTVFPTPRAPVTRERRPGAPGPSSSAIRKSSRTASRPMRTGGRAPAVGVKGFGTSPPLLHPLYSPFILVARPSARRWARRRAVDLLVSLPSSLRTCQATCELAEHSSR